MPPTTIKISEIKTPSDGKLIPVTQTRAFKQITQILEKLDTGWKPKSKPQRRTKQIYDSIRIRGWNPHQYGHIQAYKQNNDTILWSGNHRLAILTHLGHTQTTIHLQKREFLKRGFW